MKQLSAIIAVMAFNMALPASSEAYPGQQHIFTSGGLNVNICTSKGKACHIPKNLKMPTPNQSAATLSPTATTASAAAAAAPALSPANAARATAASNILSLF